MNHTDGNEVKVGTVIVSTETESVCVWWWKWKRLSAEPRTRRGDCGCFMERSSRMFRQITYRLVIVCVVWRNGDPDSWGLQLSLDVDSGGTLGTYPALGWVHSLSLYTSSTGSNHHIKCSNNVSFFRTSSRKTWLHAKPQRKNWSFHLFFLLIWCGFFLCIVTWKSIVPLLSLSEETLSQSSNPQMFFNA